MPRRRVVLGGLAAGAVLSSSSPSVAHLLKVARRPAETFTLANGLQVVVLPSARAPIVNQLVVYKVGSADETLGQTGVAHFLEHMMFKGTWSIGPTEFSRTIQRNGGRDNAYTGFDATGYYQTIASDRLELVMRMEADRMVNLHIAEKELLPERQVVLEERRMRVDNVPAELLDEAVREQLFGRGRPYAMPTAGYVEDVKKLGVTALATFYRKHYAPNNAVLIVAGDTRPEAVRKLAEKYYGPIPKVQLELRRRPGDGGTGLPQRVLRADARVVQPEWSRDFLAPSYSMGEKSHAYALSVLAQLFGGGETSRLWKAMVVDSKLALAVAAGYGPTSLGLTSFEVSATPASGSAMAALEAAIGDQMKKVLDGEVTADEVERVQNKLLASAIYSQDSLGSGPRVYASYLSTGGSVADIDAWPERIAAVRPQDVVAAARHVWRDEASVTSLLTPAEGVK